ncbi:hypothetical protein ACJRO7_006662 [Eucalyptus globulus]|uniref:Uncharacterized protein n=1 Tax=Eucalyptus globulus TaxID=34317 RepID=A0ABD3IL95_EUCGL
MPLHHRTLPSESCLVLPPFPGLFPSGSPTCTPHPMAGPLLANLCVAAISIEKILARHRCCEGRYLPFIPDVRDVGETAVVGGGGISVLMLERSWRFTWFAMKDGGEYEISPLFGRFRGLCFGAPRL